MGPASEVRMEPPRAYTLDWTKTTLYGQAAHSVNYTANSRNEYTTIRGSAPTWSANGELRDDNVVQTYNYDYRGRLTKVVRGSSTYTFKYDAFGRRIATNFGTELRFTWADDRILEEITSSTTPTVNARWVWGVDAEPLRMNRAGTLSYYHASSIGSVEKLTDTSGTSVETVEDEAPAASRRKRRRKPGARTAHSLSERGVDGT